MFRNLRKVVVYIVLVSFLLPQTILAQSLPLTKQLKQGQSDTEVSTLQRILNNLGKAVTVLGEETRFFGPKTAAAVKQLQCENGIVCGGPTWGLVGPATRGLLSRLQSESAVLDASTGPAGLVTYYTFDGDTNDSAGGNNGIATGNPTYVAGKVGQAISLDGVDDMVSASSVLSPISAPLTISAWANWNTASGKSFQVAGKNSGAGSGILIGSYDPKIALCKADGVNLRGKDGSITAGNWYLITCTWDGSLLKLYVNGTLQASTTVSTISNNGTAFSVGRYMSNSLYSGKIDDVRVYNRALSASEVAELNDLNSSAYTNPIVSNPNPNPNPSATTTSPITFALNITKSGTGTGTITGTGISCGSDCIETVNSGTSITLTATPSTGSTFTGWSGACSGTSTTCTVSMSQARTVNANFNISSVLPPTTSAPSVVGTTVAAASCSQSDVQAAINIAKDGDTVFIPEGVCEWTKTVGVNAITPSPRSLTIRGAGCTLDSKGLPTSCKTVLKDSIDKTLGRGLGSDEAMLVLNTALNKSYRITEIEIQKGIDRNPQYFGAGTITLFGDSKSVRIDHIKTGPTKIRSIYVAGAVLGLVDSSRFNYSSQPILVVPSGLFGKSWGDGSFENPVDWGGPGSLYVENNEFISQNITTYGPGALDGWAGARVVFRKNTVVGGGVTLHGTESAQRYRGGRSIEVYDNTFTTLDPYVGRETVIDLRSSTAVVFNNLTKGKYNGSVIKLNCYRTFNPFSPFGQADGTKSWDVPDLTDGPSTPGGAGNGVFDAGVITTGGNNTITDISKNWTTNQWKGYVLRQTKRFIATSGTKGNFEGNSSLKATITVAGANWTTNQWAGYEITKISDNSKSSITSNTADTLTLNSEYYQINFVGGGEFELSRAAQVKTNTNNSIITETAFEGAPRVFVSGLDYEIRRVSACLDGSGAGQTRPFVFDPGISSVYRPNNQNINQLFEPIYAWNNTIDKAGLSINPRLFGTSNYPMAVEGRDYISAPKPGYTPYIYPHPLATSGFTSDDPSSPFVAPYVPPVPPPPQPPTTTPPPTTPTDTDSDGVIDSLDRCPATPTSLKSLVNAYGCVKPLLINFDIKPDVTNLDLSSVGVLELGRTNIGKVTWKEAVALTRTSAQLDLDTNLKIERNKVTLISNVVPELNKPAQITLYGITQTNPTIKRDNVICPQPTCIINSFSNGTLVFTVTGFSTYEVVEGVTPPVITPPSTPTPPPTTGDLTPQPISGGGGNTNIYYPTNNTSVPCAQGQIFSTVTGQRCTTNTNSQSQNSNYNFTRNLTLGARGDDVKALQDILVTLGHLNLNGDPTTTYFGSATRAALIRYQVSQGITPAEGYFGPLTRTRLQGTSNTPTNTQTSSTYTRNLTVGDRGSDVTKLQNFLILQSLLDPSNNTGYFGPATKAALAAWQRAQGIIPAEGYFGALTRGRLGR